MVVNDQSEIVDQVRFGASVTKEDSISLVIWCSDGMNSIKDAVSGI